MSSTETVLRPFTVEWTLADGSTERTVIKSDLAYDARTKALVEQDERNRAAAQSGSPDRRVVSARIRTGGFMFAGPWFDLNES